jgi:2-methylcitrate dehydratase
MAASLASVGITGPARPFEGRAGLNVQLGEHIDLAGERRPGEPLKIQQTFLKYYPARYSAQLAIAVALEARTKVSIGEIASVTVFQEKRSVTSRERDAAAWKPASRESADHSQPYVIAYALARGNVTPDAYTERNYRDAEILQLAGKIDFEEDPAYTASFPGTFNCRFEVELTDGRQLTVHGHNQKGHPANPMADSEVDEKFRSLVVPLLGEQRTAQVLNYAWALEEAGDLEQLWRLIDLGSGESEGRPAADPSGSGPE